MIRKTVFYIMLIVAMLYVLACGGPDKPEEITLPDELPAEVQEWIDAAIDNFGGQTFIHEDILYLLVTYGEKPTGGYEVEITDITEEEGKLIVTAYFSEPGEDDMVSQALTYPYDLAMLDNPDLPAEFVAEGAETEIPVIE
ncbi:MAG: protease complex subunit PrcB family protein [Firmicutes bacterium]|nr:protease complex subunit PrcB family protein [Bacillota bacterium]